MQGLHLTADLHDCRCSRHRLVVADELLETCVELVRAAGLQAVGSLSHAFPDTEHGSGGVTATVLLAESHLCVHTWPEQAGVTLDIYVCNFSADHSGKARKLQASLEALFEPQRVERHAIERGALRTPEHPRKLSKVPSAADIPSVTNIANIANIAHD